MSQLVGTKLSKYKILYLNIYGMLRYKLEEQSQMEVDIF